MRAFPKDNSQQQLSVQLPDGTKCTGGKDSGLCLASFTTTAGFGNCVVVSQGSSAANSTPSPSPTRTNRIRNGAAQGMKRATPSDQQDPAQPSDSGKNKGKKHNNKNDKNKNGSSAKKGDNAAKPASGNTAARGMTLSRHCTYQFVQFKLIS